MLQKSQIKCPDCGEEENISLGSYLSGRWNDPPETGLECYCDPCNKYFYPKEEGGNQNANANGAFKEAQE